MIKAILFDVDGVIFDSEEIHYEVEAETLKLFGIPATRDLTRQYSGTRLDVEFAAIAKKFNIKIPLEDAIRERNRILKETLKKRFPKVAFIEQVLSLLSKKYLLALATMGDREFVGKEMKISRLAKYFKVSIFGEDIINPKPDPEIFLKAAESLGVQPEECVVIEDSQKGIMAGKNAGMVVIARRGNHNNSVDLSKADIVIEDLRDIEKNVENLK